MKKDLKTILLISLLIVICIVVFIIIIIIKSKQNETSNKANNENEKKIVETLSESFKLYSLCQTGKDFSFKNGNASIEDLTDENINHILYSYLHKTGLINLNSKQENLFTYSFTKDDFINAARILFGKTFAKEFNPPSILKINGVNYELKDNNYTGSSFVNACLHLETTNYHYIGYAKENDNIRIKYLIYFSTHKMEDNVINTYIKNRKDSEEIICLEKDIENYKEKFTEYDFIFTKEDDNYIFSYVEVVN